MCEHMCSIYRRSAVIGEPHGRPAYFSAQSVRHWTVESLLMSLHVKNSSDGTATSPGRCSLNCIIQWTIVSLKHYSTREKRKRGWTWRTPEKKFSQAIQRRIQVCICEPQLWLREREYIYVLFLFNVAITTTTLRIMMGKRRERLWKVWINVSTVEHRCNFNQKGFSKDCTPVCGVKSCFLRNSYRRQALYSPLLSVQTNNCINLIENKILALDKAFKMDYRQE